MILNDDNEYIAVLDACVLAPMPVCDTLLSLATEPAMYLPRWSDHILAEVARVLRDRLKLSEARVERRISTMKAAFPEACITGYEPLIPAIELPDPEDRHVVAAAILGHANAIVTFNTKDFPPDRLELFGLLLQSLDDFLVHQLELNGEVVMDKLERQASLINQKLDSLLSALGRSAPSFEQRVRKRFFVS